MASLSDWLRPETKEMRDVLYRFDPLTITYQALIFHHFHGLSVTYKVTTFQPPCFSSAAGHKTAFTKPITYCRLHVSVFSGTHYRSSPCIGPNRRMLLGAGHASWTEMACARRITVRCRITVTESSGGWRRANGPDHIGPFKSHHGPLLYKGPSSLAHANFGEGSLVHEPTFELTLRF